MNIEDYEELINPAKKEQIEEANLKQNLIKVQYRNEKYMYANVEISGKPLSYGDTELNVADYNNYNVCGICLGAGILISKTYFEMCYTCTGKGRF